MMFYPVMIGEEWHERLKGRLMARIRLRQRAARAEARITELEAALAALDAERAQWAALEQAARAWEVAYRAEQECRAAGRGQRPEMTEQRIQELEVLADLVGADSALLAAVAALPAGG